MVTWHWQWARATWPKYGHRSLEGYRSPHLCSYSWPCVYGLIPWVVLFSDDLLCLRSWHRTNQWHESLLPRDPLWLTCWFLLPNLSDLPVSTFQRPMTVFWSRAHRQRRSWLTYMTQRIGDSMVGFLQKLSTIDDVTKYRGITVFLETVYYRRPFLIPRIPRIEYCFTYVYVYITLKQW